MLTDPLLLRGRTAPSRVLFGPHETNLCAGRAFSARSVAYYARRAAGGCGVVVTEEASVHPSDWPYERAPLAADCGPGWEAVAAAVHAEGALVVAALGHAGGQGSSAYSQRELWAPSRVPEVASREVPKSMEPADIDAVVAGFGTATALAVASGCDGVEVNAGQFSLVRQFLSGLTNQRGDDYGSDRSRFAREVLTAVRAAAGDAIVGLRLSCDELAPWAGVTPAAAAELARSFAEYVDYLVVVRGSIFTVSATRPDLHTAPGFNLELCRGIRAVLDGTGVPVVLQGSVVDGAMAETALVDGVADAVEMTRAQIADPDLVATLRAGRAPRPCILCNQLCQVRDPRNPQVSCVGEPASGYEGSEPWSAAPGGDAVTVVGGGPAGLEAARVAALRGFAVTLLERSDRLGGAVTAAAASGGGRERLTALTDWLAAECERLGVEVRTGVDAPVTAVGAPPGPTIVATGGRDGTRSFDVTRKATVLTARALLTAAAAGTDLLPPTGQLVVWDPLGNQVATSIAEYLAAAGRQVVLLTPDMVVATQLARTGDLAPANVRLHGAGVRLVRRTRLRRVTATAAVGEDLYGGPAVSLSCAALIDCGPELPAAPADPAGVVVGDAVAPRTIAEAVREGRRAAVALTAGTARPVRTEVGAR